MNVVLSSVPLYLVPVVVAVAALASLALFGGVFGAAKRPRTNGPANVQRVGLLAALVVLLLNVRPLVSGQHVLSHALRLARVGSVDANLSFWLDPKSFALSLAVIVAGFFVVGTSGDRRSSVAQEAATGLGIASLLVATLADGFPSLIIGWVGFGLASAAVLGSDSPKAATRLLTSIVGSAVLISLGAGLVFWGLSGRFLDGRRYLSDYRSPFVASSKLASDQAPGPSGVRAPLGGEKGLLTMVTHPGAKISSGLANESQLTAKTEPFRISPVVRAELPAGLQKVAIDTGGGSILGGDGREIALIEQVRFPPNEEVEIRSVGPTLTFREIDAELDSAMAEFTGRQLGLIPLDDAASGALGLGVLGLAFAVGRTKRGRSSPRHVAFAAIGAAVLAASLAAHLGSVFRGAPTVAQVVAIAALAVALHAAVRSCRAYSASSFVADAGRTVVALVVATVALSIAAAGTAIAVASLFTLLAIGLSLDRDSKERTIETGSRIAESSGDATAFALASTGLAGVPIPLSGIFVGIGGIGAAALARGGIAGILIGALAAAVWAMLAHASYRAYFCIMHAPESDALGSTDSTTPKTGSSKRSKKPPKTKRVDIAIPEVVLAAVPKNAPPKRTAALVAIIGCVGGPAAGFALGVLSEPENQTRTARALIFVALAIPAAVTAHLARKRYAEERPADWADRERSGGLARFSEAADSEESEEQVSKLSGFVLAIERVFDAPIDWLARALAGRDPNGRDGA